MWGVVNEGEGTGALARCPGIDIAGKTGTAQVVSADLQKTVRNASFKNNAWFVGFAPSNKPEIVVAALVMQGEHSWVAVPLAREVIKAYFDKKTAQKPPGVQTQNHARMLSKAIAVPSTRLALDTEFR
jgi:penicillin-binding protein 2